MKKEVLINGRNVKVFASLECDRERNDAFLGIRKNEIGVFCRHSGGSKDKLFSINNNRTHMGRGSVCIRTEKACEITPLEAKIIAAKLFPSYITV